MVESVFEEVLSDFSNKSGQFPTQYVLSEFNMLDTLGRDVTVIATYLLCIWNERVFYKGKNLHPDIESSKELLLLEFMELVRSAARLYLYSNDAGRIITLLSVLDTSQNSSNSLKLLFEQERVNWDR